MLPHSASRHRTAAFFLWLLTYPETRLNTRSRFYPREVPKKFTMQVSISCNRIRPVSGAWSKAWRGALATTMPSKQSSKRCLLTSDNNSRLHGTVRNMRWKNTSSSTRGVGFVGESFPETWLLVVNQGPCPTAPNAGIYTVNLISPVRELTACALKAAQVASGKL
jgi:hypothetical protein